MNSTADSLSEFGALQDADAYIIRAQIIIEHKIFKIFLEKAILDYFPSV